MKESLLGFSRSRQLERDQQTLSTQELISFCHDLFVPGHANLVRDLCVHLNYLSSTTPEGVTLQAADCSDLAMSCEGERGAWLQLLPDAVYCKKCLGVAAKQDDADWEHCTGRCQQKLPDWHFVEHMLQEWKNKESPLDIQCARCCVAREALALVHKCIKCQRDKHISEFSPYAAKDWLGQQREKCRYYCMDCVLPECFQCKKRAPFPRSYKKILGDDGEYHEYCPNCRASDLQFCSICEVEKPLGQFRKLSRGTHAKLCITCERPPCRTCGKAYPASAEPFRRDQFKKHYYCSDACQFAHTGGDDLQICSMCDMEKPLGQFRKLKRGTHAKICLTCERPPCYNCGREYPADAGAFQKEQSWELLLLFP